MKVNAISFDRTNQAFVWKKNDLGELEQVKKGHPLESHRRTQIRIIMMKEKIGMKHTFRKMITLIPTCMNALVSTMDAEPAGDEMGRQK